MSQCSGSCPSPLNCCCPPSNCEKDQVICLNTCIPINHPCTNINPELLYFDPLVVGFSGLVSINNDTDSDCTMFGTIIDNNGNTLYTLEPGNTQAFGVNDLVQVFVDATGPNPSTFASGEATFNLKRVIKLDC